MKKFILVILAVLLLSVIVFVIVKTIWNKRAPIETGANIVPFTQEELNPSEQMYALLDKGVVIQESFEIRPITQKRVFNVFLDSPTDESKVKFEVWLKENDYDKIPKEKFIFVQSSTN